MGLVTINKGRGLTLPAIVRKKYLLKPGSRLELKEKNGEIVLVPVVKGANLKKLVDIAKEAQELAEKARTRKIDFADLQGGTFTISNIGSIGGTFFTPIINFPEAAILGVGKIVDKPAVKDGKIVIRKIMPLSLTYDHRLIDGAQAAAFLNIVISYLENPALLPVEK